MEESCANDSEHQSFVEGGNLLITWRVLDSEEGFCFLEVQIKRVWKLLRHVSHVLNINLQIVT